MNPSPVLVVTGFDAKHFDLALDLAESFRAAYQDRYRLAAIVFGAEPAPPALAAHFDQVMHLADAGAGFGAAAGYVLAYAGLKARLREVFPGHAAYIWIDADCWMQGDESLPRICAGLGAFDICVHPESDVHYLDHETPSERTLQIYRSNDGPRLAAMPLRKPMLNTGVFAMRADSRVWALWQAELDQLRQRHQQGERVYLSDQIPLHKIVYLQRLRVYPLRAIDNWKTYACLPFIDRQARCLRVPTLPHEKIGLIHLAGTTKDQLFPIDGQQLTLRYRDMHRLLAG